MLIFGKHEARQCAAKSKRSQRQCRNPACRGKVTCRFHGGRSTGPKTSAGRQRIREANWIHGKRSLEGEFKASEASIRLRHLEDALRLLKASEGHLLTGRKPIAYAPIATHEQLQAFVHKMEDIEVIAFTQPAKDGEDV